MPKKAPQEIGVEIEDYELCADMIGKPITIAPDPMNNNFYTYQWFKYTDGKWERIGNNARTIQQTFSNPDEEVYYYYVERQFVKGKVFNGDFELGNTGFTTDYDYETPDGGLTIWDAGTYTMTNDIHKVHRNAPTYIRDHTTGKGLMMAINGDTRKGTCVWEQTVSNLQKNTDYAFIAWTTLWTKTSPPSLEFNINGQTYGVQFTPSSTLGEWTQIFSIWNSLDTTSATIRLLNHSVALRGNDFAMDDIQFYDIETVASLRRYHLMPKRLEDTENQSVCDTLLPFVWRGKDYFESGIYYDTLRSKKGCDSVIYTLNLNIEHCCPDTQHIIENQLVCDTLLPFVWRGKDYFESGIYYDTVRTKLGCEWKFYILNLRVSHCIPCPTIQLYVDSQTICDTLLPYMWRDIACFKSGVYDDTIQSDRGCDSIVYRLKLDTIFCEYCLPNVVLLKWTDVLFIDNHEDKFVAYQWYKNSRPIPNAKEQFVYIENGLGDDAYYALLTYVDGTQVKTCSVGQSNVEFATDTPKKIFHKGHLYIQINGQIYSVFGGCYDKTD